MSKEIIEGNKLIAEFMGWSFEVKDNEYGGELLAFYKDELMWRGERPEYLNQIMTSEHGYAFHCNWNKLMPVVKKINEMPIIKGLAIQQTNQKEYVVDCLMIVDIYRIWHSVIQFITWHNQQTHPQ